MNIVKVNGKRFNIPNGHSVSIINGDVFVDGRRYTENENLKQVNKMFPALSTLADLLFADNPTAPVSLRNWGFFLV